MQSPHSICPFPLNRLLTNNPLEHLIVFARTLDGGIIRVMVLCGGEARDGVEGVVEIGGHGGFIAESALGMLAAGKEVLR